MITPKYWCYQCVGEVQTNGSKTYFLRNDVKRAAETGEQGAFLARSWTNFRKTSKGQMSHKAERLWAMTAAITERNTPQVYHANVAETWRTLQNAPVVAAAADFVCQLGPHTWVLYGCAHCHMAPTEPDTWIRTKSSNSGWYCPSGTCNRRHRASDVVEPKMKLKAHDAWKRCTQLQVRGFDSCFRQGEDAVGRPVTAPLAWP